VGNIIFNVAKGKVAYYGSLPAANDGLVIVLLKAAGLVADGTMADYATLADVLAGASDECDATNYVRKIITTDSTVTIDNTADRVTLDITTDPVWTALGGTTNNALGKLLVCYDPDTTTGTDSSIIPMTAQDWVYTTTGADVGALIAATGYARSA
jgi:hypothetical protein